jgi:citrate synthase
MTQFSIAITALQTESLFAKAYNEGISKKDYWDPIFEDTMNLIARLPRIAAYIYRRKYKNGDHIQPNGMLDWSANFAHMLGYEDEGFRELIRLYMTIHADHEGGNVSAHTTHLVGSALSDPYLSLAAGMNGLAGPLHGLANQEVIRWIEEMNRELNTDLPTKEQIAAYVEKTLKEGKVVPHLRSCPSNFICYRKN